MPGADGIVIAGVCVAVVGVAAYALRRHLVRPAAVAEER